MKVVKHTLSQELKYVELHTIADLHIGDKDCDWELVKTQIKAVQDNENAYCILNGDIINNATKTSVSDNYAEMLSPMEQIKLFVDLFEPIKDKILAITTGNHENRSYKEGVDITYLCATQLGLSHLYAKEGVVIFLRFGKESKNRYATGHKEMKRMVLYTIYATHGSGGGRKEGSKAVRLADMASIIDTDIYIHSHSHLPMIMKEAFYRIDRKNSTCELVEKLFVNTGSCLNYGGYGQTFEYKPNSKHTPVIYLSGTKKEFTAKL